MSKEFNIQGWCNPSEHYMADISQKFNSIMQLIEKGKYFSINRPHQYGKTTMLEMLTQKLTTSKEWLLFHLDFQNISTKIYEDESRFCQTFMGFLEEQMLEWEHQDLADFIQNLTPSITSLTALSKVITKILQQTDKKAVLFIDEVDKSSNNQLFMDFLGILRYKYLKRHRKTEKTFHSVVLVGINDIKTIKLKLRPDINTASQNSPWNIAADFEVNMNLTAQEIVPMLEEYSAQKDVKLNVVQCAEKLFFYTSGYPFLVSALCKILDEKILPQKKEVSWTTTDIEQATRLLVTDRRSNANFDHLIKSLENYPELYQLVFDILIDKQHHDFVPQNPTIHLGVLYGIFGKEEGNGLKIHNRIYSELIINYMTSKVKMTINMDSYEDREDYLLPENQLDIEKLLDNFQKFMQEQESKKNNEFLEKNGTLLFLGFLQPIINGKGYAFKEVQISNEKRIDIIITYFQHRYVIELKVWRGPKKHKAGLNQLADYLKGQHLDKGYLIIFDFRKTTKSRDKKWLKAKRKEIYAVWV